MTGERIELEELSPLREERKKCGGMLQSGGGHI